MEINKNLEEGRLMLEVKGRLDTTTAPELEEVINGIGEEVKALELDLKDLEYISSAGLRVLLAAQKKMDAAEGRMVVRNISELVSEVFNVTGFCEILTIE